MVDVGLGQLATTTGKARSYKLKDAARDAHPLLQLAEDHGGVRRVDGGESIVEEAKSGQNSSVTWVGESGQVSVGDTKVLDSLDYPWKYILGSVTWTRAEQLKNSGGKNTKYIDLVGGKYEVLEDTMLNKFHEGLLSNGTGYSGLQLMGIAGLISTTPNSGTRGGIDMSNANAAWARNTKFDSSSDWALGSPTAATIKLFLDGMIDPTMKFSKVQQQAGILGQTLYGYLNQATQAMQVIQNVNTDAKVGFDRIFYRGIPMYQGGGINYSGSTQLSTTRAYLFNLKPGGFNIVYHKEAEFDLLEPVNSQDQASVTRLMFTMCAATLGALGKSCAVGF